MRLGTENWIQIEETETMPSGEDRRDNSRNDLNDPKIVQQLRFIARNLNFLSRICREANDQWWRDQTTGERIQRNKGELIALMHSELSECLEGERKNLMDDHLPERRMAEVELVDTLIRIFDYAGEHGYDLSEAFVEKMVYNWNRQDHKSESRRQESGKRF